MSRKYWCLLAGIALVTAAVPGWWLGAGCDLSAAAPLGDSAALVDSDGPDSDAVEVRVETIRPAKGGLVRRTSQPGSAHSFESADIYSKVSGYLQVQHVDIGSRVKRGDVLAEIDVPELAKDVDAAAAMYEQMLAEASQSEARIDSAIADRKSAEAHVAQAQADIQRWDAELSLAQKQYERIRELHSLKGIEARIVDEKLHHVQTAEAGHRAAESAVGVARQQAAAATARVVLARADLQVSQAKTRVAEAALERARVMASYRRICSPYDGVVTRRNFHPGAYIRSPDQGGQVPLLAIDRVDLMRVVVRIPEREIPYVQRGDKATITFDALPNREFTASISRIAHGEEAQTRTMLAEIDLPNTEGLIRDHMYGRVEIELEEAPNGVTLPSACLVGSATNGQAQVFVAVNGQAQARQVRIGRDTGVQVEILSGISETDEVVFRPAGGLADGARIVCKPVTAMSTDAGKSPR